MGDVQSGEYTIDDHQPPSMADISRAAAIAAADEAVREAQQRLWAAEDEVVAARSHLQKMEGKRLLVHDAPTWKEILNLRVQHLPGELYTLCMQLGFGYAMYNGTLHKAGQPGEGMINTHLTESDIR